MEQKTFEDSEWLRDTFFHQVKNEIDEKNNNSEQNPIVRNINVKDEKILDPTILLNEGREGLIVKTEYVDKLTKLIFSIRKTQRAPNEDFKILNIFGPKGCGKTNITETIVNTLCTLETTQKIGYSKISCAEYSTTHKIYGKFGANRRDTIIALENFKEYIGAYDKFILIMDEADLFDYNANPDGGIFYNVSRNVDGFKNLILIVISNYTIYDEQKIGHRTMSTFQQTYKPLGFGALKHEELTDVLTKRAAKAFEKYDQQTLNKIALLSYMDHSSDVRVALNTLKEFFYYSDYSTSVTTETLKPIMGKISKSIKYEGIDLLAPDTLNVLVCLAYFPEEALANKKLKDEFCYTMSSSTFKRHINKLEKLGLVATKKQQNYRTANGRFVPTKNYYEVFLEEEDKAQINAKIQKSHIDEKYILK